MDPIRPFTTLIRSLRESRKSQASGVRENSTPTPSSGTEEISAHSIAPARELQAALRARLQGFETWDAPRARTLFVEYILLNELGADLHKDPGFSDVVTKVSTLLGEESKISTRLDELLRELVAVK